MTQRHSLVSALAASLAMMAAASPQDAKPRPGVKLGTGEAETHRWGQPSNGLRAALAIRTAPSAKKGDAPDLHLVVQNVSDAPIRLSDTVAPAKPRTLTLKVDGKTKMIINDAEPTRTDVLLRPGEVAYLPVFAGEARDAHGQTPSSLIAEGVLKDAHQNLVASMELTTAPKGAWAGKLTTGAFGGSAAKAPDMPEKAAPTASRP